MPPVSSSLRSLSVANGCVLALLSCGRADDRRVSLPIAAGPSAATDSLVATNSDGVQIWYTLLRVAQGADGGECVERGLEIRRGTTRVKVPLLYTRTIPVFLNDSTIRATLWTHCRPGDPYLVNLRSGQPVREPARGKS